MGGTEIYPPLKEALKIEAPDNLQKDEDYRKVIFLLTDRETDDKKKCYEIIENSRSPHTIIHTFGIGNDCDAQFVQQIALKGEGICEIMGNE